VSVDITKLAKAGHIDLDPKPDERWETGYKATIESIRDRGIDINESVSINDIVAEYARPEGDEGRGSLAYAVAAGGAILIILVIVIVRARRSLIGGRRGRRERWGQSFPD
jgi:hypothetical protein